MIHFFRLMRPTNLVIIAATMYSMGWYFDSVFSLNSCYGIGSLSFFLLVFSTLLIAAGGNIINDYFDIKADRINRPSRLIITRHVKPRVAIINHWLFNFIAFSMALYLSYTYRTFWYLFIHLLSINLLWIYSMRLKRTLYFGNIVIALLTALVPVLVGIFYYQTLDFPDPKDSGIIYDIYPFQIKDQESFVLGLSLVLGGFAFILNWAREIVKDMEDLEGDKKLKAKTIPIALGYRRAKLISALLLLITMLSSLGFIAFNNAVSNNYFAFVPAMISALLWVITLIKLIQSNTVSNYRSTHKVIKWVMIFGLILPGYWAVLVFMK